MSLIKFIRTPQNPDLPIPAYATAGAAGFDLRACVSRATMLYPDSQLMVPTGWRCALPHGYELQIRPRSGLAAKHNLTIPNAPGTLDSDYRGEIIVCLRNYGTEHFEICRGDRIAQAVLAPVTRALMIEALDLDATARGVGGFGSTGIA